MARKPTPPAVDAREATHQSIAADIAEFRRRGGRIQVLGNTPLRSVATSLSMAPAMIVAQGAAVVDLDGPLLLARDREPGLRYDGSLIYPPERELWG